MTIGDCIKHTSKKPPRKPPIARQYRTPSMEELIDQYNKLPHVRKARREAMKNEPCDY